MSEQERELGWDDEIEDSGPGFILLPVGDYNFTVEKFERARHPGSEKLPPCNKAVLTLKIDGGEHGESTIMNNLFLHSKTEGFLSAFFESIGQKKEGERVKMNWGIVTGAKGRVKLNHNKYINNNGVEVTNNQVDRFLPYEEYQKHASQQQAPQQQSQQPQQQQQYQAPFQGNTGQQPNTQNQPQTGFTQGQF